VNGRAAAALRAICGRRRPTDADRRCSLRIVAAGRDAHLGRGQVDNREAPIIVRTWGEASGVFRKLHCVYS
jgi:hypothetical protein